MAHHKSKIAFPPVAPAKSRSARLAGNERAGTEERAGRMADALFAEAVTAIRR
jgi:hypothetical protein